MIYVLKEERITPACAGSTKARSEYSILSEDHPRLRGEYYKDLNACLASAGSPPLARGARIVKADQASATRITPACAGSTTAAIGSGIMSGDHPRLRGEYCNRF